MYYKNYHRGILFVNKTSLLDTIRNGRDPVIFKKGDKVGSRGKGFYI